MILATAAVGENFTSSIQNIFNVLKQRDIHILTDQADSFPEEINTYSFSNTIWSYFDKLLFIFHLAKKYDTDVFYFDVNKVDMIKPSFFSFFKGSKNICVKGVWEDFTPNWLNIKYKDNYWKPFVNFLKVNNIEPNLCPAYCEQHIYIPKGLDLDNILIDLETVKPVLEYCSIIGENKYSGIGSGEGAGLGYAVIKNKLEVSFFNKEYFST